jgi:hypothetical protein
MHQTELQLPPTTFTFQTVFTINENINECVHCLRTEPENLGYIPRRDFHPLALDPIQPPIN